MNYFDVHTHHAKENSILNCFPKDKTPNQWFSVGIHPWHLEDLETQKIQLLEKVKDQNCKAIGEFGFDRLCGTSLETQEEIFNFQFELAHEIQKPVIIHCVRAFDLLIPKIKNSKVAVIIHGFNQNEEIFNQLMQIQNVYLSFGAALMKENSNAQKALKKIDTNRFFLETDEQLDWKIKEVYTKTNELLNLQNEVIQKLIISNIEFIVE